MPPFKHSKADLTQSLVGTLDPGAHKVLFVLSKHLWQVSGLILNMISPFLPFWGGFSFALGCRVSFFGGIQHSPADDCSAASCNFGVHEGEDEHTSFYSSILSIMSMEESRENH